LVFHNYFISLHPKLITYGVYLEIPTLLHRLFFCVPNSHFPLAMEYSYISNLKKGVVAFQSFYFCILIHHMRTKYIISLLFCGFFIVHANAQAPKKKTTYELYAESAAKTPGEEWLQRGDDLYKRKNVIGAVACYGWAADQGNADAQFKYGYALYFGEGIGQDFTSSAMWFKRAALQGHAKAMNNLAYCYMYGKGVPANYDKALQYLKDSAIKGCKSAQVTLAECYKLGVLVEQDEKESKKWELMASSGEGAGEIKKAIESIKEEEKEEEWFKQAEIVMPELKNQESSKEIAQASITSTPPQKESNADNHVSENNQGKETVSNDEDKPEVLSKEDILNMQNNPASTSTAESAKELPQTSQNVIASTPPVIKILFPVDRSTFHTNTIKVKYQLIANGLEDQTRVTVMVDGIKQPADRTVKAANTIDVDLPNHDCTVVLYAQNAMGNSEPSTIHLVKEVRQEEMPRLLAVAIGIGDYHDPLLPPLKFTCKDARDFCTAISKKKHYPYSEVQVKLLCDSMATRDEFFESMEWLKQEATPNDICVFFYAGHGCRDEKDRFYFMPYGSNTDRLYNCFNSDDFRREANDINSKFIVFVDACYSGALLGGSRSAGAHFIEQLRRAKNGTILYASSASDTKSKEDETWENGAFTKVLLEAFSGAAREDNEEGLSTQQLEEYLYKEVRRLTDYKQTPIFINPKGIEHFNLFTYDELE